MGKTGNQEQNTEKIGDKPQADGTNIQRVWIFGYGSILWQTGFKYHAKKIGYIKGYDRVFWQGNTTHRGTQDKPGRVATLTLNPEGVVWGAAYEVVGEAMIDDAMKHLNSRECTLGGYKSTNVTFYPRDCQCHTIHAIVFSATPGSRHYLGPESPDVLTQQILECSGPNGTNAEYVLFLTWFLRKYIPEADGTEKHLFDLEHDLLKEINLQQKCVEDFTRPHLRPMNLMFESCKQCITSVEHIRELKNTVSQEIK